MSDATTGGPSAWASFTRALLVVLGVAAQACSAGPSPANTWRAWNEVDPASSEGREARRRLAEADARYRLGIDLLRRGEAGAREALVDGMEIAPMNPALYLPLARACKDRGYRFRAAEFYRKCLVLAPGTPEAAIAQRELQELDDPFGSLPSDESAGQDPPARMAAGVTGGLVAVGTGAALATVTLAVVAVLLARRGRPIWSARRSLAELAAESPELHPAIAYLVGCLRHELLKHRVGAVGDAVRALARAAASPEQRQFLARRLYGGEPLEDAWRSHLRTFERALGPRFALEHGDRGFRDAGRAIAEITALRGPLAGGEDGVVERLERAHRRLEDFDRALERLVAGLVRSSIDRALLLDVVEAVRAEYAPGQVALDELSLGEVPPDVVVEVYRADLVLVLKNIVRNAVLAVDRAASPRRVKLDVTLTLEATGEEVVRLRVQDTSPEPLTTRAIYDRRVGQGLGIVTAALDRYDGAVEVGPGDPGYAKAVSVRLFRVLDGEAARARDAA